MSRRKVSTTVYITPEQAERLKLLHERTKVPIAAFIREGIDMMLKHYEPVLPGQMSLESASPLPPPVATRREVLSSGETAKPAGGRAGVERLERAERPEVVPAPRSRSGDETS